MEITPELLAQKLEEAKDGMLHKDGNWRIPYDSCMVTVAEIELEDGEMAIVTIKVARVDTED